MIIDPILVALLFAAGPFVIAVIKQPGWPRWASQAVAVGVSGAFGLAAVWLRWTTASLEVTPEVIIGYVTVAFTTGALIYGFLLSGNLPGTGALSSLNKRLEGDGPGPPG